ncbi:MAG TPA: hypothetical protein ENL16_01115 [Candidatus Woesearchaeota archaeon]|nr:hypothetical protein [Candidatus Woesearchaeota archaeon]
MVKIARKDFCKELDAYIEKRRAREKGHRRGFSLRIALGSKKKAEEIPDIEPTQVHVEYKQPGFLSRLFSFRRGLIKEATQSEDLTPEEMARLRAMEDDIEETEKEIVEKEEEIREIKEEEAELVEKRESLLKTFFNTINIFKRKPMKTVEVIEEEVVEEPALDEDVVEVLKIVHKWLEQLSPAKKRSFKASKDFQKYKSVLEKYGLIKEKKRK